MSNAVFRFQDFNQEILIGGSVEGAVEAALGTEDSWESILTPLDERALAAKVEAIAAHESQINTFWASVEAMGEAVRAYAKQVGGERVWRRE